MLSLLLLLSLPLLSQATALLSPAFITAPQSIRCAKTKESSLGSCRPTNGHDAPLEQIDSEPLQATKTSHIVSITSRNLAGMKNEDNSDEIVIKIDLSSETVAGFVAVTGESGSGKSLLVSKAIDLVTGGKAVASIFPLSGDGPSESSIELGKCLACL